MLLTFLLIMIPVYALGLYIYNWGLRTVREEVHVSAAAQSGFYLEELEREIERIRLLQFESLNDDALSKLAFQSSIMGIYDIVQNINLLRQRLIMIQNSSSYIDNVSAHLPTVNRTISSKHGLDRLMADKYQNIRAPEGQKGARIVLYEGQYYMSTIQFGQISALNPVYTIEIALNEHSFLRALHQFDTYEGSASALISLSEGHPIIAQTLAGLPLEEALTSSSITYQEQNYDVIYTRSDYLNMGLLRFIPTESLQTPLHNFYLWLWVFSITAMILIAVYSFSVYRLIHKPLLKLVQSFRQVESGDLSISIQRKSKDEFGYLYEQFNQMVKNLRTLITQVYQQKLLAQRAELKQLQSQINPHFLYNSFFIINTMARLGDENLIAFSKLLGEYYQYITRNTSDQVSLAEEIRHASTYAEIMQTRFTRRLKVRFEPCPEAYTGLMVPRLILQPIIENAFNHGVEQVMDNGLIAITFEEQQDQLRILVEDSGHIEDQVIGQLMGSIHQTDQAPEAEITGLINIHRRLQLVFGEGSGLRFERSEYGGLKVTLVIKWGEGARHV